MWVHIVIFIIDLFLFLGLKKNFLHIKALEENKRIFFMLTIAGNFLGILLTWQNGGNQLLDVGGGLPRREDIVYTEEFIAVIQGEEVKINVQIPEKVKEEVKVEKSEEPKSTEQRLLEEILALNEEKKDDAKYYLPQEFEAHKIQWEKPGTTQGAFLASLFLLSAVVVIFMKEKEKTKIQEKRMEQMLQDYPGLVMKLTLLVQAGMTVRSSFRKMALDYKKRANKDEKRYAYEEIVAACHEMESGITEADAYERFAVRCNQMKYKTLATLLVQNLQRGSGQLLDMLERESVEAFEDRKRKARVSGEAAATKLLIPMMLMLLVVLAIVMIPAVVTFYG